MRTKDEIQKQVDGLESQKDWLPEWSKFGNHNWAMIDAQVAILEGDAKEEDYADECEDDDEMKMALIDVEQWMSGDSDDDLFEEKP